MKQYYLTGVVCVLAIAGVLFYTYTDRAGMERATDDTGAYAYLCSGGVELKMAPAADMSTITIVPGSTALFDQTTLVQKDSGQRYEGGGIVFTGAGESVHIVTSKQTLDCSPVPNERMAPFNFGDPAEGAGPTQDTAAAARAAIVGTWKSTDDASFVRSFSADGSVVDSYGGKKDPAEHWTVFTSVPPDGGASLPADLHIVPGTAYLKISTGTDSADDLYFSIQTITPERLEMTYLARGNTLSFTRVQ